ncbi:PfkB family carbohydrate kinase [Kibdelosporangium lantanae]
MVGQIARDLVLLVDEVPDAGGSVPVRDRREMLGGKGANLAVASAQLGMSVAVLGVVGDDEVGAKLLDQARADGIDVTPVVRRTSVATALIVDIVTDDGKWRYLEDVPDEVLLTEADVEAAQPTLAEAAAVIVQLQQPAKAALTAARHAGRLVVLEGAVRDDEHREPLLAAADVLRADSQEAELLTGQKLDTVDTAVRAARHLMASGPAFVVFALDDGNLFVWADDHLFLPMVDTEVVDTTGSGDAFTAALTAALVRGQGPHEAARRAVAAAAATVGHPGGRPDLRPDAEVTDGGPGQ